MNNPTLFQFFHWYYHPEGNLWQHAAAEAANLAKLGVTQVWLPPAYKSAKGLDEPGYAVYDLYDLGEFDQKGTVRTRYGTKEEYLQVIKAIHDNGMQALADMVLNHRIGGDEKEKIKSQKVNADNRLEKVGEPVEIEAFTKFTFPGRKGKYSDYIWNKDSFSGFCCDDDIYMIVNEYTNGGEWEEMASDEKGNYDYLMGSDIEFRNPHVVDELKKWGCWYIEQTGIDGVRLDALKHIPHYFFTEWLQHLSECFKKEFWAVGEYWNHHVDVLLKYIELTGGAMKLLDVPLHYNIYHASTWEDFDLRTIFDNTLVQQRPDMAVTFVDNHDTQPLQALESYVEYWFKPLAYALILLRQHGTPCVFYATVYEGRYEGYRGEEKVFVELNKVPGIDILMMARKDLAYGEQHDYWDDAHMIGWTREGIPEKERSGLAVLISSKNEGKKWMSVGAAHAGKTFRDITGNQSGTIILNEQGEAEFSVGQKSVSVWADESWSFNP